MKIDAKKIIILLGVAVIAVGITYVLGPREPRSEGLYPVSDKLKSERIVFSDYIRYPGQSGKNALELLREFAAVDAAKSDFGEFVNAINGKAPDSEHFWKLYINGTGSQVGADALETVDTDVLEWKIEKIQI